MRIKMSPIQVQKQVLAPAMQQAIEVLLLPVAELSTSIDQEIQANPLLEIDEQRQNEERDRSLEELWEQLDQMNATLPPSSSNDDIETKPIDDIPLKKEESLEDHLLQQLRVEVSDPLEIQIGEMIIGDIDEDGYLTISCEEIADILKLRDLTAVEKILKIIQTFEPIGIASRDIQECLLTQIKNKDLDNHEILAKIIKYYFNALGKKQYTKIAKDLNVPVANIQKAAKTIAQLEPRPARNYRPLQPNTYIQPDLFITKNDQEEYTIYINDKDLPPLRINPYYKHLLEQTGLKPEEKEFLKEKLRNGILFIKSIHQRGQTIKAVTQYITDRQQGFFENGHLELKPLVLKDVAKAIDRNESTISRAVSNKYVSTPRGMFPIKFFFSQAVGKPNAKTGKMISSRSIKEEIRQFIIDEDKASPYSDQSIQDYLEKKNMKVARRTIAKYRQALKILPSHLRKQRESI
ncbi:MAG: RNA polymerase factor sigma-54 [Candidatus Omnitrophica bacterium]|nr:RNA polymerase factor sigma-54 [Candidatus Omnitrophota bacterium]